ncbi:MAG: MarR family transcriptional regulator [Kiloniellales bacterium]|nr:MarR family transcriptional regulator [Kiloniellales bacterium]
MKRRRAAAARAKTPTDDYVLEAQVGHLLRRAHQRASAIFAAQFAELQLTPTQYAALVKIHDEGEVSQNHLGRLTAMDPATMKGVIDRLDKRGLIVSKPDPKDRRRTLWRLTGAAEELLAPAVEAGRSVTEETLAPLSPEERAAFLALLARLT